MKFRKKPVVIEAFQWWPGLFFPPGFGRLHELAMMEGPEGEVTSVDDRNLWITTLEGEIKARPGDWIIKGIKGEFYPCKPDIFALTYDLFDEDK